MKKIQKCQIIVNYKPYSKDIEEFMDIKNFKFFTDDPIIHEEFLEKNRNISDINSYFGLYNEEANNINEISINRFNDLDKFEQENIITNNSITNGLKFYHLQRLIFLEKIHRILLEDQNTIFIFRGFAFHYSSIMDIGKELKFDVDFGICEIKNNEIKKIDFQDKRNNKFENLSNQIKFIDSLNLEKVKDSFTNRLNETEWDIKLEKLCFFLINNETDFYLKPIYPILHQLRSDQKKFSVLTFDDRTKEQLKKKDFKSIALNKIIDEISFYPYESRKIIKKIQEKINDEKLNNLPKSKNIKKNKTQLSKFKQKISYDRRIHRFKRKISYDRRIHRFKRKTWNKLRRLVLQKYFNSLQYNRIIRSIVSHKKIKPKLIQILGITEDNDFHIEIPFEESEFIINYIEKMMKNDFRDIILNSYIKYFTDESHVNNIGRIIVINSIFNHIIKKNNLNSVFVAMDGSPANNVVCELAKKFNIKTFSFPQIFIRINKIQTSIPSASTIFVSGTKIKDSLLENGMESERIIISGNPRYDFIKNNKTQKRKNIKKFSFNKKKYLIIIAMSRWHENDEVWISKLIEFCDSHKIEIIIKVHPMYRSPINYSISKEKIQYIKNKCKNKNFVISHTLDISQFLNHANILITEHSIVAVEAALNNIPIILTKFANIGNFEGDEYVKERIARVANSFDFLKTEIINILENKETCEKMKIRCSEFSNNFNFKNDGLAAKRITNIISNA